ncbi:hypothetical protein ACHHYP_05066 [Achlya hypogyna]|uniref:Uncharacterized protein n=1 Tax=Achlya hypogyna TaxID=1202772 RepID=A0A1V9YZ75_ACHHY|nr:hypothetical protein ACHHYP_05066 [Achlya hypogyna]
MATRKSTAVPKPRASVAIPPAATKDRTAAATSAIAKPRASTAGLPTARTPAAGRSAASHIATQRPVHISSVARPRSATQSPALGGATKKVPLQRKGTSPSLLDLQPEVNTGHSLRRDGCAQPGHVSRPPPSPPSTSALVLTAKRPIADAVDVALQASPSAKAAATISELEQKLAAATAESASLRSELAAKDQTIATKDQTIADFTIACAKFKGDCESFAATALSWKTKCEAAEKDAVVWKARAALASPPKPSPRRSSSAALLRANAAWTQAVEGLETNLADAETLIQAFQATDSDAPQSPVAVPIPEALAVLDARLQRMPLQLEDDSMATLQDYERQLYGLKKELRRLGEFVRSQHGLTLVEDEFTQYKLSAEDKLHRSQEELQMLRSKLLGLAKAHCEQMAEAVGRMNVLEDTIEVLQAGAPVTELSDEAWKAERAQLNATVASYETTHVEFQAQLATLQKELAAVAEEKGQLAVQCSALQAAVAARSNVDGAFASTSEWVIDVLRARLDQVQLQHRVFARPSSSPRIAELEVRARDAELKLRERDNRVRELETEAEAAVDVESLQMQLDSQERQITALRAQRHHESAEALARLAALEAERIELDAQVRELHAQTTPLQQHIVSLTARYEQAQANAVQLDATLDAQQAHIVALERTKGTMATKLAQLERAMDLSEKQAASQNQAHAREHAAVASLQAELAHLKKQNDGLAQLLGRQEAALTEAQAEARVLQAQVDHFQLQQVQYDQYKHEVAAIEEILATSRNGQYEAALRELQAARVEPPAE